MRDALPSYTDLAFPPHRTFLLFFALSSLEALSSVA